MKPDLVFLGIKFIILAVRSAFQLVLQFTGERGLVVGRWTCNPEVPGSSPPPCHWMDLSSVAPNSTPSCLVNSQLVSLPPGEILTLLCLICIVFVCNAHLIIFTWNLRDRNVNYYLFIIIYYLSAY